MVQSLKSRIERTHTQTLTLSVSHTHIAKRMATELKPNQIDEPKKQI